YTVPYFWGTVGIIYDTTIVDEADLAQGWNLLRNTDYAGEIYMYDSERDSFMVALKALGYSMNTTDTAQLDEAYDWLVAQRDAMEPVYVGDDVIDNMISGNKAMAVVYSGDAAYMITENRNLNYFTPEEGTNIWYDCMVITKNCTDTELAHQFINFMLEDESALKNSEAVGYSSPVDSAFEEMRTTVYEGISAYEPRFGHPSDEVFGYQETELKKYLADLWTKVTAY
ncbi:MAG: extracellular solute-binding protein, partial [Lachnospiraceae bacterium]|nr:extracellular solute-binding protein [Lachnospiraceae bacterium]